jgi:hypothetical protein
MKIYRFKTEEEMIKDFGEDWKRVLWRNDPACWILSDGKNHLLGQRVTPRIVEDLKTKEYTSMPGHDGSWCVVKKLLVEENI